MVVSSETFERHGELYRLFKEERFHEALRMATLMEHQGIPMSRDIIYYLLQGCTKKKDLDAARQVHFLMQSSRLDHIVCLADYLIRLYALCGSLSEADQVFWKVSNRTKFTWNAIISAYANGGDSTQALELYMRMQQTGKKPDKVTFLSILKACGGACAINEGRMIHEQIIMSETQLDVVLGNTLVDMYAKCGSLEEAHKVFKLVPNRNVVSWDAIIGGYAQHGRGVVALKLFHQMQKDGVHPDRVTFLGVLRACSSVDTIGEGVLTHDQIIKSGLESDVTVASTLVDMYAKCGSLGEARMVFDKMTCRNLVSWGAMLSGYAQHGHGSTVLDLFENMKAKGLRPDKYIYSCVLKACGIVGDVVKGRLMHEQVTRAGLETCEVVGNTLVDMYAKCGSMREAQRIFDRLQLRNQASWGAVIAGYVQCGSGHSALKVFEKMQQAGFHPSKVTCLCVVKACSSVQDKEQGELIHDGIVKNDFEQDVLIGSALVDMYAKFGNVEEARQVFDRLQERNIVTWGAMLTGYAQQGLALPSLELYEKLQLEDIEPNKVIFLCILKACCSIGIWSLGCIIHSQIIKSKLETDMAIGNTLVDMYAKCGSLQEAQCVFDKLSNRDVVSYNAIIMAHSECGNYKMAIECLEHMCIQGLKLDDMIYTSVLAACSHAGLVDEGYMLFNLMRLDFSIVPTIEHFTCMVDLLGHAGRLKEAEALIQTMHISPDIIIWRSLLTSCRMYGSTELGIRCFDNAVRLEPDDSSVYMLMSNIYMDSNRWDDVHAIQEQRMRVGARKKPGKACIEAKNKVYEFVVGDESLSTNNETSIKVKSLIRSMRWDGYMPQMDLVLYAISDEDKEVALYGDVVFDQANSDKGSFTPALD